MASSTCCFCSHLNPVTARFCNDCGSPLELMPCKTCNAVNPRPALRCHGCDAPFASDEADRSPAPEIESVLVVQRAAQAIEAMRRDIAASPSTRVFPRPRGESANERHDVASPADAANSVAAGTGVESEAPRTDSLPAVPAQDVEPAIVVSDRHASPAPDPRIGADPTRSAATFSAPGERVAAASPRAEGDVSQDAVVRRGDSPASGTSRHRARLAAIAVAVAALALSAALNVPRKGETGADAFPEASSVPGETRAVGPDIPPADAVSGASADPTVPAGTAPAAGHGAAPTALEGSPAAADSSAPVTQDKSGETAANAEPPAAAVAPASKASAGSKSATKSAKSSKPTVRRAAPPRRPTPAPGARRPAIREGNASAPDPVAAPAAATSPPAALDP